MWSGSGFVCFVGTLLTGLVRFLGTSHGDRDREISEDKTEEKRREEKRRKEKIREEIFHFFKVFFFIFLI